MNARVDCVSLTTPPTASISVLIQTTVSSQKAVSGYGSCPTTASAETTWLHIQFLPDEIKLVFCVFFITGYSSTVYFMHFIWFGESF